MYFLWYFLTKIACIYHIFLRKKSVIRLHRSQHDGGWCVRRDELTSRAAAGLELLRHLHCCKIKSQQWFNLIIIIIFFLMIIMIHIYFINLQWKLSKTIKQNKLKNFIFLLSPREITSYSWRIGRRDMIKKLKCIRRLLC